MLINWTQFEQKLYSDTTKVVYPNVVTLSQIYSMICQRLVEDGVKIDPITHQPVTSNSAVVRASIRTSKLLVEPDEDIETPHSTKEKYLRLLESCLNVLRLVGSHYVYRGILVILQAVDALMLLIAMLGFYFDYRLT